jgi:hypothetical protein
LGPERTPGAVAPVTFVLRFGSRDLLWVCDFFDDEFGLQDVLLISHRQVLSEANCL